MPREASWALELDSAAEAVAVMVNYIIECHFYLCFACGPPQFCFLAFFPFDICESRECSACGYFAANGFEKTYAPKFLGG